MKKNRKDNGRKQNFITLFLSKTISLVDILSETHIGVVSIYAFLGAVCFDILLYRGFNIIWYPHSAIDIWLSLLFNFMIFLAYIGWKSYFLNLQERSTKILLADYFIYAVSVLSQIIFFAAWFAFFPSRRHHVRYDYSIGAWVLELIFCSFIILAFHYGYYLDNSGKRKNRKPV